MAENPNTPIVFTPLNTIYSWFETGDFPTQAQFQASWSSFWHKSENLPMSSIDGLNVALSKYVTNSTFNTHLNDENAHPLLARIDASNISEADANQWKAIILEPIEIDLTD